MTNLAELPSPMSGLDVSLMCNDNIPERPVVTEVTARGPKLRGVRPNDPASTVRTTWMRLESRIWIREDIPRTVVRAARRRYPFARIERFRSVAELAGIVGEN